MATIKMCTDLEQSKVLTGILKIETADMHYHYDYDSNELESTSTITKGNNHFVFFPKDTPCWSLAALVDVLPKNLNIGRPSLMSNYKGYYWIQYYDEFMKPNYYKTINCFNNSVDACVDMILKLHELNLL